MKKRKLLAVILLVIFVSSLGVFTKADVPTYQYVGTEENGHIYNNVGVAKFKMTGGHFAFCVDINTVIQKNQDYIRLGLEESADMGVLIHPERVRAILNYSWNKTGKDEITAIQYALWHYMNGHSLPSAANQNVKDIYNKLLDVTQTPSIPASQETETNVLTLEGPTSSTIEIGEFYFEAYTSLGVDMTIEVLKNGSVLATSKYDISDQGDGFYQFKWFEEFESGVEITIKVTTLNNKSVGAWVFFAIDDEGNIDKSLSQTVAGIKPSETFQTKDFTVTTYTQPTTTQPPTTTTITTELETTTTIPETTTTVSLTEPETTETAIATKPTTVPPLTTTTSSASTLTTTTCSVVEDDEFPITGEPFRMALIAIGFMFASGGLFILVIIIKTKKTRRR